MSFSCHSWQGTVTKNVWGGCMMLPAALLRGEAGPVLQAWGARPWRVLTGTRICSPRASGAPVRGRPVECTADCTTSARRLDSTVLGVGALPRAHLSRPPVPQGTGPTATTSSSRPSLGPEARGGAAPVRQSASPPPRRHAATRRAARALCHRRTACRSQSATPLIERLGVKRRGAGPVPCGGCVPKPARRASGRWRLVELSPQAAFCAGHVYVSPQQVRRNGGGNRDTTLRKTAALHLCYKSPPHKGVVNFRAYVIRNPAVQPEACRHRPLHITPDQCPRLRLALKPGRWPPVSPVPIGE